MKVVHAERVPGLKNGTGDLKVLLSRENAGARNGMLGIARVEPGIRIPSSEPFSAHDCEEFSYMISGRIRVWVEGEEVVLGPGDAMIISPGERHYVTNDGDEPAETVWVLTPPIEL